MERLVEERFLMGGDGEDVGEIESIFFEKGILEVDNEFVEYF